MFKFITSIVLLVAMCQPCSGAFWVRLGGPVVGGEASCPEDSSPDLTYAVDANVGMSLSNGIDANRYGGNYWTVPGSGIVSVCKIAFKLTAVGTISSDDLYAQIFNKGVFAMGTQVTNALSSAVTGDNSWDETWVVFTFATPVELTAGTEYIALVSSGDTDATNYFQINKENPNSDDDIWLTKCNVSDSSCRQSWPSEGASMRAYYYD